MIATPLTTKLSFACLIWLPLLSSPLVAAESWSENFNNYAEGKVFFEGQPGWMRAGGSLDDTTVSIITKDAQSPFSPESNGKGWLFKKSDPMDMSFAYGVRKKLDPIPLPAKISFEYKMLYEGKNNLNSSLFLSSANEPDLRALTVGLATSNTQPRNLSITQVDDARVQLGDIELEKWYRVEVLLSGSDDGTFTISRTPHGEEPEVLHTGTLNIPFYDLGAIELRAGWNDATDGTTGGIMIDNFSIIAD